jgi:hypothetical protein
MKKLLVVMLVLGMASAANAALWMTVNSGTDDITVAVGDTVAVSVYGDGGSDTPPDLYVMGILNEDNGGGGGGGVLDISGAGIDYAGSSTLIRWAWDNDDSFDWSVDSNGVEMVLTDPVMPPATPKPLDGLLVHGIVFTCTGEGDVVLTLGDPMFTPIESTQITITQTPEPMTMALLGLGGLFLRRRK